MPTTLREMCSDMQSELKANNIDDRYSYRFLSSRIKDKIRNFIKQDADNRKLFKLSNVWITFPVINMEEVPYVNYNVDIQDARNLRKSKTKIPNTFSTNYGNLLRITSISGDLEYHIIKRIQYKQILNAEYRDKRVKYAWLENGFLYIPDSNVEKVLAIGLPENPEELNCEECSKPLDTVFSFPDYLIDVVKKDILNELISTKKVPVDANPNLNENSKV